MSRGATFSLQVNIRQKLLFLAKAITKPLIGIRIATFGQVVPVKEPVKQITAGLRLTLASAIDMPQV